MLAHRAHCEELVKEKKIGIEVPGALSGVKREDKLTYRIGRASCCVVELCVIARRVVHRDTQFFQGRKPHILRGFTRVVCVFVCLCEVYQSIGA